MPTDALLQTLFDAGLDAVRPPGLIQGNCRLEGKVLEIQGDRYDLNHYERIFVLGSGKAAVPMASELESLLGDLIYAGVVISPRCEGVGLERIACIESDHPIPTQKSLLGAQALIEMLRQCRKNDLYIYLLSGGTSALIESPVEGLSLEDMQLTTDLMLKNALNITQINSVRKHLSAIKGGRLGEYSEGQGIVLTLSDVIGDDLYSIGSAPLYADQSSYKEVVETLEVYGVYEKLPPSVRQILKEGMEGLRLETPKKPSSHIKHYLVGTNLIAREATVQKAHTLGLDVKMIEQAIDGDVEDAVEKMLELAMNTPEQVIVFGGEVTVKVKGNGRGGRNQHAALCMLRRLRDKGLNFAFLSAGTDGIDGNSDAAGAYIDAKDVTRVDALGLNIDEYIAENDANGFFSQLGGLITTGPTGTNVMDIAILVKEQAHSNN